MMKIKRLENLQKKKGQGNLMKRKNLRIIIKLALRRWRKQMGVLRKQCKELGPCFFYVNGNVLYKALSNNFSTKSFMFLLSN
mmetsp:Transcript_47114/g.56999  ORF Transcript_47114/g.56999 Transcript_47114/m.56999 type:complete len:82 (+) Transcript_47114:310-555(+)